MSNAKLDGSSYGTFSPVSLRRSRRTERQFLINNIAIAVAFLFLSAVIFGLIG